MQKYIVYYSYNYVYNFEMLGEHNIKNIKIEKRDDCITMDNFYSKKKIINTIKSSLNINSDDDIDDINTLSKNIIQILENRMHIGITRIEPITDEQYKIFNS